MLFMQVTASVSLYKDVLIYVKLDSVLGMMWKIMYNFPRSKLMFLSFILFSISIFCLEHKPLFFSQPPALNMKHQDSNM